MLGAGIVGGLACQQLWQLIAIASAPQLAASAFLWRTASGNLPVMAVSRIWDISWTLLTFWLACEAETCCAVEGEGKAG